MKIRVGQYVETFTGRVGKVTRISGKYVTLKNISTGVLEQWDLTNVKPLCIQEGDKVTITYFDGVANVFTLVNIIYIIGRDIFLYKFKNPEGSNETFSSEEFAEYIDTFTE